MSEYTHRMTLAVPEQLIPQANQLALIAGESPEDVNTFAQTSYQDAEGNKYAVCSTVIKPIVLSMLNTPLSEGVLQAEGANLELAQEAMDKLVMYSDGVTVDSKHMFIAIDIEPLEFFGLLGLTMIESDQSEL